MKIPSQSVGFGGVLFSFGLFICLLFCLCFFFLIKHIATFQTGLFWLLMPRSKKEKKKKKVINMIFFPLASFYEAAEVTQTNCNYHHVLNP